MDFGYNLIYCYLHLHNHGTEVISPTVTATRTVLDTASVFWLLLSGSGTATRLALNPLQRLGG